MLLCRRDPSARPRHNPATQEVSKSQDYDSQIERAMLFISSEVKEIMRLTLMKF
jgi:hypothetical protein